MINRNGFLAAAFILLGASLGTFSSAGNTGNNPVLWSLDTNIHSRENPYPRGSLEISPDGQKYVDGYTIWDINNSSIPIASLNVKDIVGQPQWHVVSHWSPDGKWVASQVQKLKLSRAVPDSGLRTIFIWDPETGQIAKKLDYIQDTSSSYPGFTWSQDGKKIALSAFDLRNTRKNNPAVLWDRIQTGYYHFGSGSFGIGYSNQFAEGVLIFDVVSTKSEFFSTTAFYDFWTEREEKICGSFNSKQFNLRAIGISSDVRYVAMLGIKTIFPEKWDCIGGGESGVGRTYTLDEKAHNLFVVDTVTKNIVAKRVFDLKDFSSIKLKFVDENTIAILERIETIGEKTRTIDRVRNRVQLMDSRSLEVLNSFDLTDEYLPQELQGKVNANLSYFSYFNSNLAETPVKNIFNLVLNREYETTSPKDQSKLISTKSKLLMVDFNKKSVVKTINASEFTFESIGDIQMSRDGQTMLIPGWTLAQGSKLKAFDLPQYGLLEIQAAPAIRSLGLLEGHTDEISSAALSPDGSMLASGSSDNTIRFWNMGFRAPGRVLPGHAGGVTGVTWSPDGQHLASSGADHTIRIWNALSGKQESMLDNLKINASAIAWNPNGRSIAFAGFNGNVNLWTLEQGVKGIQSLGAHEGPVWALAWNKDGSRLASGSDDSTVRIWEAAGQTRVLQGHTGPVHGIAWKPDGTQLVSASWDKTAKVWNTNSGELQHTLAGHTHFVTSVAWSANDVIATGSADRSVRLWNPNSETMFHRLNTHAAPISGLAFNADGSMLASASLDKTIRLWGSRDGRPVFLKP
jgi:WD40 repeat protein